PMLAKGSSVYPSLKVLVTTYYTHNWSEFGRYKKVSQNNHRLGNFVALNFLPGGSIIMIPRLFKGQLFEVADTFGGRGYDYFKGERYWKIDILRDKGEFYEDIDSPVDLYIVKYNKRGEFKNREVKRNALLIYKRFEKQFK
ncbi:MAG: hypothetical protein KKD13_03870, partial [Candidatus Margulisbacteria bacterium]|nr:hypothetical protein [Candidatus Margulisiibacteriota bacterium]